MNMSNFGKDFMTKQEVSAKFSKYNPFNSSRANDLEDGMSTNIDMSNDGSGSVPINNGATQ